MARIPSPLSLQHQPQHSAHTPSLRLPLSSLSQQQHVNNCGCTAAMGPTPHLCLCCCAPALNENQVHAGNRACVLCAGVPMHACSVPQAIMNGLLRDPGNDSFSLQAYISANNTVFLFVLVSVVYAMVSGRQGQSWLTWLKLNSMAFSPSRPLATSHPLVCASGKGLRQEGRMARNIAVLTMCEQVWWRDIHLGGGWGGCTFSVWPDCVSASYTKAVSDV